MDKDSQAASGLSDGEAGFLDRHFRPLAASYPGAFGLEDDAALIEPPEGSDLVVTTDALIAGVHFMGDEDPADIAFKALAVNVSDLAAKAAKPIAYSLVLALSRGTSEGWIAAFAKGLGEAQTTFGIALSGGDTTTSPAGPLMISVTAFGSVPHGRMVRRGRASAGDMLYVSGTVGDSALGLKLLQSAAAGQDLPLDDGQRKDLIRRYLRPQPRVELREALLAHASAAMDISDGLAIDATRMCKASGVSAKIDAAAVPLSQAARVLLSADPSLLETVLTGGDDYEILTAVPEPEEKAFVKTARLAGIDVARIGAIEAGTGELEILAEDGVPLTLSRLGYDHLV